MGARFFLTRKECFQLKSLCVGPSGDVCWKFEQKHLTDYRVKNYRGFPTPESLHKNALYANVNLSILLKC